MWRAQDKATVLSAVPKPNYKTVRTPDYQEEDISLDALHSHKSVYLTTN